MKHSLLLIILLLSSFFSFGQGSLKELSASSKDEQGRLPFWRCATVEVGEALRKEHPELQGKDEFESFMRKANSQRKSFGVNTLAEEVYYIPVIVHIIHSGGAVGEGSNISEEQVLSQIEALNEDFRRMEGSRGFNDHPDGADTRIEFVLADIAPDGSPLEEVGIHRVRDTDLGVSGTLYIDQIEDIVKPATIWDPNRYLNMWTAPLDGGLLGYAQFPVGSGLDGLDLPGLETGADTDGVVMEYRSFGSSDKGDFDLFPGYDKGRVTTHEVGHYLGLRHIWGDGGCGVDDYCTDTPESDGPNFSCPTGHVSCGTEDMIENYMDYSGDLCMNIFTQNQKERMYTVLEYSPRRKELLDSDVISGGIAQANFVADKTSLYEGQEVTFTDRSRGNILSWNWTFDGGEPASSTEQNPVVTYPTAGTFPVSLSVTDEEISSEEIKEAYITVNETSNLPTADFSADRTQIFINQQVQFQDLSDETVYSWEWTFEGGEPANSTEQNPVVTYPTAGTFPVSLTVTNAMGTNSQLVEEMILAEVGPMLSVSPSSFTESLLSGEVITRTLSISNPGDVPLTYSLSSSMGMGPDASRVSNKISFPDYQPEKGKPDTREGHPIVNRSGIDESGSGYSWIDSNSANGPAFDWIDISSTGTQLYLGDDNYETLSLPFEFPFYEELKSTVYVASNGFLSFNAVSASSYNNTQLPNTNTPNDLIAGYWTDLHPYGNVHYLSTADHFIVQFTDVQRYSNSSNYLTFQFILYPNGEIKIQYLADNDNYYNATIGIEDSEGTSGMQIAFNTEFIEDNLAVLISQQIPISIANTSGEVAPGGTDEVAFSIDAEGLMGGSYTGAIRIASNDPRNEQLNVPVNLDVTGRPLIELESFALDFGSIMIGESKEESITINNTGTDLLEVIPTISSDVFSLESDAALSIPAGTAVQLNLIFNPLSTGSYATDLTLATNDDTNPELIVELTGIAEEAPLIAVTPESLSTTLVADEQGTETLLIQNNGEAALEWQAQILMNLSARNGEKQKSVSFDRELAAQTTGRNNQGESMSSAVSSFENVLSGEFTELPASPNALTCLAADPSSGYIYGQAEWASTWYRFNPNDNTWSTLTASPLSSSNNGGATYLNGKIYTVFTSYTEMGIYDIAADSWTTQSIPFSTGNITTDGSSLYLVAGYNFIEIDPVSNTISELNNPSVGFNRWGGLEYFNNKIYGHTGDGSQGFAVYDLATSTWTELPSIPGGAILGSAIDPFNQVYYTYGSYGGQNLYAFDIRDQSWSVGNTPFVVNDGGIAYVDAGAQKGIYLIQGESGTGFAFMETFATNWLNLDVLSGTIEGGASQSLSVNFDATDLIAGTYEGIISLNTNDPLNEIVSIPASLLVEGTPSISWDESTLDFGSVLIGESHNLSLTLTNDGSDVLEVNAELDNDSFVLEATTLTIPAKSSYDLALSFNPLVVGEQMGSLILETNDPENPALSISLSGMGITPPALSISEEALAASLYINEVSEARSLVFSNEGGAPLQLNFFNNGESFAENSKIAANRNVGFHAKESKSTQERAKLPTLSNKSANTAYHDNILETYPEFIEGSYGMAWINDELYVLKEYPRAVYIYNFEEQVAVKQFDVSYDSYSLTWDGEYLWVGDYNVAYGYDLSGNLVGSFELPFYDYHTLAWDGEAFLVTTAFYSNELYRINETGEILNAYTLPYALYLNQIAVKGSTLWALDGNNFALYQLALEETNVIVQEQHEYPFESYGYSLAIDKQGALWGADWYTLYKLDFLAMANPEWLQISSELEPVEIAAGESYTLDLTFQSIEGMPVGTHTFELGISTNDPEWPEASVSFTMEVLNSTPTVIMEIPDQSLVLNEDVYELDLSPLFNDLNTEQILTYHASSSDGEKVAVLIEESQLTVTPLAGGSSTVSVYAKDPLEGTSETFTFVVTVIDGSNQAPQAIGQPEISILQPQESVTIALGDFFEDADQDPLEYTVSVSNDNLLSSAITDNVLTLTALSGGEVTVSIIADDQRGGTAELSFAVTINSNPEVVEAPQDQYLVIGKGTLSLDLSKVFSDPEGDLLSYSAESNSEGVVTMQLTYGVLTLSALEAGETSITLKATDDKEGSEQTSFTVGTHHAPEFISAPDVKYLQLGEPLTLDLIEVFTDADGDELSFTASVDDPTLLNAEIAGASLNLSALKSGEVTISILADDQRGATAEMSFTLILNSKPEVVETPMDKLLVVGGENYSLDLSEVFTDPEGDLLSFSAESSSEGIVDTQLADGILTLSALKAGETSITLKAADDKEGVVQTTYTIGSHHAPVLKQDQTLSAQVLELGDAKSLNLYPYFSEADGEALSYQVSHDDGLVSAEVIGTVLEMTAIEVGEGKIQIIVTDARGAWVSTDLNITVSKVTGLEGDGLGIPFVIYPNPFTDRVNIKMENIKPGNINISVYDQQGREVHSIDWEESSEKFDKTIDLSSKPAGLYILSVMTTEGKTLQKLIKK